MSERGRVLIMKCLGSSCDALWKRITRWLSDWLVSMEITGIKPTLQDVMNVLVPDFFKKKICKITHARTHPLSLYINLCIHVHARFVYMPFQVKYGWLFDTV